MILEFSTKINTNGNRYYLAIDTDNKTYSLESWHIYRQQDVITITSRGRDKLIKQLESDGFKRINYI